MRAAVPSAWFICAPGKESMSAQIAWRAKIAELGALGTRLPSPATPGFPTVTVNEVAPHIGFYRRFGQSKHRDANQQKRRGRCCPFGAVVILILARPQTSALAVGGCSARSGNMTGEQTSSGADLDRGSTFHDMPPQQQPAASRCMLKMPLPSQGG